MRLSRLALAGLLALALFALAEPFAALAAPPAPARFTVADTQAALEGAPPLVRCIVRAETGGTFDPYSVGDGGHSFGVAQLYDRGLLRDYRTWGAARYGTVTPFDPYSSVAYLEHAIAVGLVRHWHTARGCGA